MDWHHNWFEEVAEPKIEEICGELRTICDRYGQTDERAGHLISTLEMMLANHYSMYHRKVGIEQFQTVIQPLLNRFIRRHTRSVTVPQDVKHWRTETIRIISELDSQIEPPSFPRIHSMQMGAKAMKNLYTVDLSRFNESVA